MERHHTSYKKTHRCPRRRESQTKVGGGEWGGGLNAAVLPTSTPTLAFPGRNQRCRGAAGGEEASGHNNNLGIRLANKTGIMRPSRRERSVLVLDLEERRFWQEWTAHGRSTGASGAGPAPVRPGVLIRWRFCLRTRGLTSCCRRSASSHAVPPFLLLLQKVNSRNKREENETGGVRSGAPGAVIQRPSRPQTRHLLLC